MLRFMDPFAEFDRLLEASRPRFRSGTMPMDAFETNGKWTLRFDLPGIHPENVDVTVENNTLTVTAERSLEDDTEGANWLVRERPTGRHSRQVYLSDQLETGEVDASYNHGVLTVTIPVKEAAKPHRVQIKAGEQAALTG